MDGVDGNREFEIGCIMFKNRFDVVKSFMLPTVFGSVSNVESDSVN